MSKEIKGIQTGKEEINLLLFADVISYIESPKNATKNYQNSSINLVKISGYKTNMHFYTLTVNYQREKFKKNPFYNCIKKNKITVNKLEVKDLYSEKYKTLIKEIEGDINCWKDILAHGLEELILLK